MPAKAASDGEEVGDYNGVGEDDEDDANKRGNTRNGGDNYNTGASPEKAQTKMLKSKEEPKQYTLTSSSKSTTHRPKP